ncbi:MAG: HD domain-containing protein [Candidatus Gastranaerophilales bacterium]|nr:HD domain-containing protein [Candidatus Gastranaerophilales bacterium]
MENLYSEHRKQQFRYEAISRGNPKWENSLIRTGDLSHKEYETRSEFERDYNRILNSSAYSRLKHKTQVFFATNNDHVCTRIEHVNIVASIAKTIARSLGLNVELVEAIAFGHDLGHSPFGHHGERIIAKIMDEENINLPFWHEKNSLRIVDYIETLPNRNGEHENLALTYAVRDGIVCHCGEVDENGLRPRNEFIDLDKMFKGQCMPYTYEGCVVKISDKLAYIGRDIEDASLYGFFTKRDYVTLKQIAQNFTKHKMKLRQINPTSLIYELVTDLCMNSSPDTGLNFSAENYELMNQIKKFVFDKVCMNKRLEPFMDYANLVIRTIYKVLQDYYDGENTIKRLKKHTKIYPLMTTDFRKWLIKYSNIDIESRAKRKYKNKIIYDIHNFNDYRQAIIDFISCMTDKYIMKIYNDLITF